MEGIYFQDVLKKHQNRPTIVWKTYQEMICMDKVIKTLPKQHEHAWGECVSAFGYICAGLCFLHAHRSLGQISDEHQVHAEREPLSRRGLCPSGNGEADAAELQAGTYHTHQRTTGNEA